MGFLSVLPPGCSVALTATPLVTKLDPGVCITPLVLPSQAYRMYELQSWRLSLVSKESRQFLKVQCVSLSKAKVIVETQEVRGGRTMGCLQRKAIGTNQSTSKLSHSCSWTGSGNVVRTLCHPVPCIHKLLSALLAFAAVFGPALSWSSPVPRLE